MDNIVQQLVELGYNKYFVHHKPDCQERWQKRIDDGNNVLYYIDFYYWEIETANPWSIEVRLYHDEVDFDLNRPLGDQSVKEVEAFYANAYKVLNCVPDTQVDL